MNSAHQQHKACCQWNANDKSPHIQIDPEGTLSYVGPGKSENDAAAIRTVGWVPASVGVFYWEMRVLNKGRDGHIAIGVGSGNVSLNRLPGWEAQSVGWHGDDGFLFVGSGNGAPFGPCYTSGDVVGCGLDFINERLFFTRNAVIVGTVPIATGDMQWFPMTGFRTPGEQVEVQFEAPFMFDLCEYKERQKFMLQNIISNTPLLTFQCPAPGGTDDLQMKELDLSRVLLNWLLAQGFLETSEAFFQDAFERASYRRILDAPLVSPGSRTLTTALLSNQQLSAELALVRNRMSIVGLVKAGKIKECLDKIDKHILETDRILSFRLHTQHFIELIRSYYQLTEHAIDGNEEVSMPLLKQILDWGSFLAREYPQEPLLNSLFCLIAYKGTQGMSGPAQWALTYFDLGMRDQAAALLNAAMQAEHNRPQQSQLETLVRQSHCVRASLAEIDGSTSLLDDHLNESQ